MNGPNFNLKGHKNWVQSVAAWGILIFGYLWGFRLKLSYVLLMSQLIILDDISLITIILLEKEILERSEKF